MGFRAVARRVAEDVLAEIGADMSRFPSARHLASWAKLSPGNYESAGKRRSGYTGRGSPWLSAALVEAAQAAARTKDTYLFSAIPQDSISKGPKACHRSACPQDVEDHLPHASRWDPRIASWGATTSIRGISTMLCSGTSDAFERLGYRVALEAA